MAMAVLEDTYPWLHLLLVPAWFLSCTVVPQLYLDLCTHAQGMCSVVFTCDHVHVNVNVNVNNLLAISE